MGLKYLEPPFFRMKLLKFTALRVLATLLLFLFFTLNKSEALQSNASIFVWLLVSFLLVNALVALARKYLLRKAVIMDLHGVFAGEADYYTTRHVHEKPGMRDLVQRLQMRGYKVALLSNNNWEGHQLWERKFGLSTLFDDTMVSGEAGFKKPGEEVYRIMLSRLGVSARNAVFVDDREDNVLAAKKVGMHGIVFKSVDQLARDLNALGYSN